MTHYVLRHRAGEWVADRQGIVSVHERDAIRLTWDDAVAWAAKWNEVFPHMAVRIRIIFSR